MCGIFLPCHQTVPHVLAHCRARTADCGCYSFWVIKAPSLATGSSRKQAGQANKPVGTVSTTKAAMEGGTRAEHVGSWAPGLPWLEPGGKRTLVWKSPGLAGKEGFTFDCASSRHWAGRGLSEVLNCDSICPSQIESMKLISSLWDFCVLTHPECQPTWCTKGPADLGCGHGGSKSLPVLRSKETASPWCW